MKPTAPTTQRYQKLIAELKPLIQTTVQTGSQALNAQSLDSYWKIGRKLKRENNDTPIFLKQVAHDAGVEPSLLYRSRRLHDTWPDGLTPDAKRLAWRTHIVIFGLAPKQRDFYTAIALTKGWNRDLLSRHIAQDYYTHYHARPNTDTPPITRDADPLHIYKASVLHIVDGDTLDIQIDLGFHTNRIERIRLRGLNTTELAKPNKPSLDNDRAQRAKAFVAEKLQSAPFVVVKTYKTDLYGRYLADVFYHPNFVDKRDVALRGFYLNEELLKAGLADVMMV